MIKTLWLMFLVGSLSGGPSSAGLPDPDDLSTMIGVNYHRSSGFTSLDHWQNYDAAKVAEEVAFLAENGSNTIRTFLNFDVYEADPTTFLSNLQHYAEQMVLHNVLFMPVFFDSFGIDPSGDVVADATSTVWVKTPSEADRIAPDFLARASVYIADVTQVLNNIILGAGQWWLADLWNEPSPTPFNFALLAQLLTMTATQPNAPPTTVGFAEMLQNQFLLEEMTNPDHLTILTGHPYGFDKEVVLQRVNGARALGDAYGGKQVAITEISIPGLFQNVANISEWIDEVDVGVTFWEAYVSNNQFKNIQGIFYPESPIGDQINVRNTTAVNAFWALSMKRNPEFSPPYIAVEKPMEPGFVLLAPASNDLSTGDYHRFIKNYAVEYGSADFPALSLAQPGMAGMYLQLMNWSLITFAKVLTIDPETTTYAIQNITDYQTEYFENGNVAAAEAALFNLLELSSNLMTSNNLGEPDNYAPRFLTTKFETILNAEQTAFDLNFEVVIFDVDKDDLFPLLFVRRSSGAIFELPLTQVPGSTVYRLNLQGLTSSTTQNIEIIPAVTDLKTPFVAEILVGQLPQTIPIGDPGEDTRSSVVSGFEDFLTKE